LLTDEGTPVSAEHHLMATFFNSDEVVVARQEWEMATWFFENIDKVSEGWTQGA